MHDKQFEEFDLDGVNAYKESGLEKGLKRDWTGVRDVADRLARAALDSYKVEIERKSDANYIDLDGVNAYKPTEIIPIPFKEILKEMAVLYTRKNADYGNSFDKSLDEDGLLVAKIRLGDKLSRFSNLIKQENQVKDESMRDTLIDLANYAVMTLVWLDNKAEDN